MNRLLAWLKKLTHRAVAPPTPEPERVRPNFLDGVGRIEETKIDWQALKRQKRLSSIAKNNEDRQKATMGYGLQSKNFRPRPAAEKKLWNIQKKPTED